MTDRLRDRAALITGASRGLGFAIARAFAEEGARVCICARDGTVLESARSELASVVGEDRVYAHSADVSDPDAAQQLVSAAADAFPDLAILVNNAAIQGPMGAVETNDWAAWRRTIEINLFGSVLMARAMVGHLRAGDHHRGKLIQLSGGGATSARPGVSAYASSKAAVVRFVETLAEELHEEKIDVNAIAPGALNTRMLDEILTAGPERVGKAAYDRSLEQRRTGGTPLDCGTQLAVWLASDASDGISGKLLSAVWDPWPDLAARRAELDSDIYTLRRIVPADRGYDWGER